MKNNPVKTLAAEHKIIERVEIAVNLLDRLWEAEPAQYKEFITKLIRFFREYSDIYHHQKEETVLFPELDSHPEFFLHAILHELEAHHEAFRDTVNEMEDLLSREEFHKLHSVLKQYINDLRDHIAVENEELFIMAENMFSVGELENMYFKFVDIDTELGADIKAELENIPKEIEQYFAVKNEF